MYGPLFWQIYVELHTFAQGGSVFSVSCVGFVVGVCETPFPSGVLVGVLVGLAPLPLARVGVTVALPVVRADARVAQREGLSRREDEWGPHHS